MIFFIFVVLPALGLLSLVIGMIWAYRRIHQETREEQILTQRETEGNEEASEEKKDIIYVSSCCAFVLLSLSILYLSFRATEPVEHSSVGDGGMLSIMFAGLTPMLMMFMFFVGCFISFIMSLGSFIRSFVRGVLILITCLLFLFSLFTF